MRAFLTSLIFLLQCSLPISVFPQSQQASPHFEPWEKAWKFADKQVAKMTTDEKIGQIVHIGINAKFANQDSDYFKELRRQVVENHIGGIIYFGAPIYESTILGNRMQALAKFPLILSIDAETGIGMRFDDATNFPWNMAIGATGDPDFARRMGVITGREARAIGVTQVFSPVLDVNNNAGNPVINVRSFGEDPEAVARLGTAFIDGVQSQRVIATAKHFPGHGDTNTDSHRGLPVVDHSLESLEKTELVPFRAAINAGVGSIMIAHISLPQLDGEVIKPLNVPIKDTAETDAQIVDQTATIPATLSYKIQTGLLRKQLGFNGLIVTDAMNMSGLTIYFDQPEAAVRAFLAGADVLEFPANVDDTVRGLREAVKSGRIPMTRLNDAVRRQLAWKYELGLFNERITPIDQIDRIVSGNDSTVLTDEIATKAITLVRNGENLLPLDRSPKIALFGISNGFDGISIMASLTNELRSNGVNFTTAYLQENSTAEQIAAARKTVADADIVIVGLYGRVRTGAKNSVSLPENGSTILREMLASSKKVIGVSFGNPYVLTAFPEMKTYLVAYGDMPSLQRAAARALIGAQDITGHLPISLPGMYARGTGIQFSKK